MTVPILSRILVVATLVLILGIVWLAVPVRHATQASLAEGAATRAAARTEASAPKLQDQAGQGIPMQRSGAAAPRSVSDAVTGALPRPVRGETPPTTPGQTAALTPTSTAPTGAAPSAAASSGAAPSGAAPATAVTTGAAPASTAPATPGAASVSASGATPAGTETAGRAPVAPGPAPSPDPAPAAYAPRSSATPTMVASLAPTVDTTQTGTDGDPPTTPAPPARAETPVTPHHDPATVTPGAPSVKPAPTRTADLGLVNINTASVEALNRIPGAGHIGDAIVRHRPYRSVEDLVAKRVLRRSLFDKIRHQITSN